MDQANEANHPHSGLAVQCQSYGDGLHAQVLRSGGRGHVCGHERDFLGGKIANLGNGLAVISNWKVDIPKNVNPGEKS